MYRRVFLSVISILCLLSGCASVGQWEKYDRPVPTKVVVRVLASGAKAMTQNKGALVVIRDKKTGKELARGAVTGYVGDDVGLMRAGYPRLLGQMGLVKGDKGMLFGDRKAEEKKKEKKWRMPDPYFDLRDIRAPEDLTPLLYETTEDAARFEAVLNISKPTEIEVEASGPLSPRHSEAASTASTWVFPGEDIVGEGIVLELKGLIVDIQAPLRDEELNVDGIGPEGIPVLFYMSMMDGSPIAPGGLFGIPWEAEGINITVQAYYGGKLYHEQTTTADKLFQNASMFLATVPLPDKLPAGRYKKERVKIRIMAIQPAHDNYGLDELSVYFTRIK
ncbi:MAG: hypothetical protein ABSG42_03730 [Nitrospirota bacterium]